MVGEVCHKHAHWSVSRAFGLLGVFSRKVTSADISNTARPPRPTSSREWSLARGERSWSFARKAPGTFQDYKFSGAFAKRSFADFRAFSTMSLNGLGTVGSTSLSGLAFSRYAFHRVASGVSEQYGDCTTNNS